MTPEAWIRLCCEQPADRMGLAGRKGRIAEGYDADLVLFDPDAEGTTLPVDSDASLWSGDQWRGAVQSVWRRGVRVVAEGQLIDEVGSGEFIPRRFS